MNSEAQYHKILGDVCAKYGKIYSEDLKKQNIGGTDHAICAHVAKALQLNVPVEQLVAEVLELTATTLPHAPMKHGAERLLNHLRRNDVLFALVTNSMRHTVMAHFTTKPHIFKMFHHMVCAGDHDVKRGKPFPDPYLLATTKFPDKPNPVKCLVFEDSVTGLVAGLQAKMQVVMTPASGIPLKATRKATIVLKSLQDFKPEEFGLPPFKK